MKKYILILLTLLFVGFSYAQNKEEETEIPYSKVEQKPRFQECKDVPENERKVQLCGQMFSRSTQQAY